MKPPVNINDLMTEWSKDSKIDETEPHKELARVPSLHSKYLIILSHHNMICKKLMFDYAKMKNMKWEYYSGNLNNPEDLKQYNIEPFLKKVLKQDISMYIDSDDDLNNILMKKMIHQEIVDFCSSVMKELSNRTYQLNGIIKWDLFSRGN
jgi:hypothetical protein